MSSDWEIQSLLVSLLQESYSPASWRKRERREEREREDFFFNQKILEKKKSVQTKEREKEKEKEKTNYNWTTWVKLSWSSLSSQVTLNQESRQGSPLPHPSFSFHFPPCVLR